MNKQAVFSFSLFLFGELSFLFWFTATLPQPVDFLPILLPFLTPLGAERPERLLFWLPGAFFALEIPLVVLLPFWSGRLGLAHFVMVAVYGVLLAFLSYRTVWRCVIHNRRVKICREVTEYLTRHLATSLFSLMMALPLLVPPIGRGAPWGLPRVAWTVVSAVVVLLETGACISAVRFRRKPLFQGREIRDEIRQLQTKECDARKVNVESDPARRLFFRAVDLIRAKKLFLLYEFTIIDLARRLYTNKMYLSRTINTFSGRGYRSFINFFRIKYSIELFRANMGLKVHALAELAGFHSQVTYTTAFKMETGMTPGEYFGRLIEGFEVPLLPEYPSIQQVLERSETDPSF